MRAILSVYDKTGLSDFARGLVKLGFQIFSTGGTKKALQEAGVPVDSVSHLTGFPEILDGRVKTLHPAVHGGILAKRNLPQHMAQLSQNKIEPIDLVAVNLYPFVQTISKPTVTLDEALENIDIGGPTMIRASAKNFPSVLVVVDPQDYQGLLDKLQAGSVDPETRKMLAQKAFQHVASYDTAIAQYLRRGEEGFPSHLTIALNKHFDLRYGENPHQKAAFYREDSPEAEPGIATATQLGGEALSFNNILDLDSAANVAGSFAAPTIAIIKHTNPCGLASHANLVEAYKKALEGDPVAAFGGIVAINRPVDLALAQEIDKTHYDAIIAPEFADKALALLHRKKALRLVAFPAMAAPPTKRGLDFRRVKGGLLIQSPDFVTDAELKARVVSKRQPTQEEWKDLIFGWRAVQHIKSNAIVLVKGEALLGMGAGQPSRVVSVRISLERAGSAATGSALASDAFFPFPDGPEMAAQGGVTAIIEPGGSVKDQDVIETANKYNVALVFTGVRHFKH